MLASLALTVFAPAFHCHQFGEATRMARDAGFSAVFVGSGVLAVFGTIRAFRREVESSTLEMALARPVSRTGFFLAKTFGACAATVLVGVLVFATALVTVEGAAVGGRIADRSGDLARVWGPCVAAGTAVIVLPPLLGAALNRFARCRFVLTSVLVAFLLSLAGAGWALVRDPSVLLPLLPAALPLVFLAVFFVSAAAAFSFRFRANAAAALTGVVVLGFLPFVGNYYLAEALANGGRVGWTHVALSAAALMPAVAAFLLLGCRVRGEESRI